MNNNNCCSICIDTRENNKDFCCSQCKNSFHQDCINQWISKNPSCPICRYKFQNYDEYFDYELEQLIVLNDVDILNAIIDFYKEIFFNFIRFFFPFF
jgi:hypothetical protein